MSLTLSSNWSASFEDALQRRSAQLFGRAVQRHESGLPASDPFNWFREKVNSELQRHTWVRKDTKAVVRVWFDFVKHSDINACAFRDGDFFFISINHIVLAGMTQLFSEVLRRTEIFPKHGQSEQIGRATRESPIQLPVENDSDEARLFAADAGVATVLPEDPARLQLCLFAARICLDLLYFHELNHILLGHVAHCEHRFGPCGMFEAPTTGSQAVVTDKEIEFVADRLAGTALARCLISRRFTTAGEVEDADSTDGKLRLDRELTLVILFAVGMFFSAVESQLIRQGIAGIQQYPYSETRWLSVLRGFELEFKERGHPLASEMFTSVFQESFRNIMIALTESGYDDKLFGPAFTEETRRRRACDQLVALDEKFGATIEVARDFGVEAVNLL